jgi:hypothetical protein
VVNECAEPDLALAQRVLGVLALGGADEAVRPPRGELRSAEAEIETAARERIDLARTAVVQAQENLRRLRSSIATAMLPRPTSWTARLPPTRSQQCSFSAAYRYLARLE